MTTFRSTPLFGGALIVDLPSTFTDIRYALPSLRKHETNISSTIRQVPDHQEVYLDKDGFTSIIFDITERVGAAGSGPATDGAAMTTHLEDIVDSDIDTVKVWSTSDTKYSKLPYVFPPPAPPSSASPSRELTSHREGTPAYTLIATQTPPPPNPAASSTAPDFTAIVMNLIRLESEHTDVLITINVPHIKGEYTEEEVDLQMGKQGRLIEDAVEIAARIWETFKIKDWGLFSEV
jgi:hypothetical protein